MRSGAITAELIGTRLVVWNPEEGMRLYRMGFFGSPWASPSPSPGRSSTSP
jgi:hypothetical protein